MNFGTGLNIVVFDLVLVRKLLAPLNQLDHWHLDAFLLLKSLLYRQNSVVRLEVERYFGAGQCLYD